jgi:hypothetical protein
VNFGVLAPCAGGSPIPSSSGQSSGCGKLEDTFAALLIALLTPGQLLSDMAGHDAPSLPGEGGQAPAAGVAPALDWLHRVEVPTDATASLPLAPATADVEGSPIASTTLPNSRAEPTGEVEIVVGIAREEGAEVPLGEQDAILSRLSSGETELVSNAVPIDRPAREAGKKGEQSPVATVQAELPPETGQADASQSGVVTLPWRDLLSNEAITPVVRESEGAAAGESARQEEVLFTFLPSDMSPGMSGGRQEPVPVEKAPEMFRDALTQAAWREVGSRREVTFELQPERLGRVHLTVLHQAGKVSAHIEVDNYLARDALQAGLLELRQDLITQGIRVGELNVSLGQQAAGEGGWTWAGGGEERQLAQRGSARLVAAEERRDPVAVRCQGGLDLMV